MQFGAFAQHFLEARYRRPAEARAHRHAEARPIELGHDAHAVFALEPRHVIAPRACIGAFERRAQRLQLHDLGLAELARKQRRAVLAEDQERGRRGDGDDRDQQ